MIRNEKQLTVSRPVKTEIKVLVLVVIAVFSTTSCLKSIRRTETLKIIKQWTGKEIRFPSDLFCTALGKDTACIDLYTENFKIVLYVDSIGCTSCQMNLAGWKKIMQESDTVFIRIPEFVFIFQPKQNDEKLLQSFFKQNGFSHPIFIDRNNEIYKLNNFPLKHDYQCFLVDKDNKVVTIGNPADVSGIWQLFKRVIMESENIVSAESRNKVFFKKYMYN